MHDNQRQIAFEILYAENAAPLYRFALRLCGNREDAEDMAAEALAQAYRCRPKYRGDSSLRTWLCAIVLNQWRIRKRRRTVQLDPLENIAEVAASFKFEDMELAEAISSLSEPLREAFLLVKGEGFTHAEAAKVLRVPIGTAYSRVYSATQVLRRILSPDSRLKQPGVEAPCKNEM